MTKPNSDDAVERMLNEIEDLLKHQQRGEESEGPTAKPSNGKTAADYDPDATVELDPVARGLGVGARPPAATPSGNAPATSSAPVQPPAGPTGDDKPGPQPAAAPSAPPTTASPPTPSAPTPPAAPASGAATGQSPQAATRAAGAPPAAPPEKPAAATPAAPDRPTPQTAKPREASAPSSATEAAKAAATASAPTKPATGTAPPATTPPPRVAPPASGHRSAEAAAPAAPTPAAQATPARDQGTPAKDQRTPAKDQDAAPAAAPTATATPAQAVPAGPIEANRMTRRLTTRLGQLLVDDGLLSESDLGQALEKQQQSGERLGALLVNEGYIEEGKLLSALETQYGVPAAALDDVSIDPALAKLLPREMAERSLMVPLARRNDAIDVAMVDPTDFVAMAHIRFATGLRPNVFITTVNGVRRTIARLYGEAAAAEPTSPPAPDARTDIKRMILDRDRLLMAADEDPRKFYQAAATIDAFVDEIMRKAKSSSD